MAAPAVNALRTIVKEIRLANKSDPKTACKFVLNEFREMQTTSEKVCRGPKEALHRAQSYACHLESVRRHQEILEAYRGGGERSIEETARMVGLKMPIPSSSE